MTVEHKDFPLQEVVAQVTERMKLGNMTFYQKWSCKHCGSRQTMETPNQFFRSGICEECKQTTIITHCNYMIHIEIAP